MSCSVVLSLLLSWGLSWGLSGAAEVPCPASLPPNATLWRNNQTHELYLPLHEDRCGAGATCAPTVSWEASADIQSGDVLLVHINDTLLERGGGSGGGGTTPKPSLPPEALAVYSVTRPAHANCDVSDGVLLDISPLTVDGTKLVALYDKDLTEGVNLLIIMSATWGTNCAKLKVTVKSGNCGDNEKCSEKGLCYTTASMEGYECQCCAGYKWRHCEERDACYPNPCLNYGFCSDFIQGHEGSTFQCYCLPGFTGELCEDTSDPCGAAHCQHGGKCRSSNESAQKFKCDCQPGYGGPLCQHDLDPCHSGPCQHGGKCRSSNESAQQFKCDCPPGYGGPLCQHDLDPCASQLCNNNGFCVNVGPYDGFKCFCKRAFTGNLYQRRKVMCGNISCLNGGRTDGLTCNCTRGYTGKSCDVKIDLCDPNPCSFRYSCHDKGNSYSCECPEGFSGPGCFIPTSPACSASPCRNGGTCWSSVDSFYCTCRPGFTGDICNEEVVIEVIPSAEDPIEMSGGDKSIDLQMPVSIHLDHLHNVYVAAGTLACALLIVIVIVVIRHCRMHKTYKTCCLKSSTFISCNISRFDSVLKKNEINYKKGDANLIEGIGQEISIPALYCDDFSVTKH